MIETKQFIQLLDTLVAVKKDIGIFNSVLMQAQLEITANATAAALEKLNALEEEILKEILTYLNLSDSVTDIANKTILLSNLKQFKQEKCK